MRVSFWFVLLLFLYQQTTVDSQLQDYFCYVDTGCSANKRMELQADSGEGCCRDLVGFVAYGVGIGCSENCNEFPPIICQEYSSGVCSDIGLYNASTKVSFQRNIDANVSQVENALNGRSDRCLLMMQQSLCLLGVPQCNNQSRNYLRLCNNSQCYNYYNKLVSECTKANLNVTAYLGVTSQEEFCPGYYSGECQEAPIIPTTALSPSTTTAIPPTTSPPPSASPVATSASTELPPQTLLIIIVGVCAFVIALMCLLFLVTCLCCLFSRRKQRRHNISNDAVMWGGTPEDPNGSIHSGHMHRIVSPPNGFKDGKGTNGDSKHHPLQQQVSPTGSSITSDLQSPTTHIQRQPHRTGSRQQCNPPQSPHSPHSHQINPVLHRQMSSQSDRDYPMFERNNPNQQQQWMSTFPRSEGSSNQVNHSESNHSVQGILAAAYTEPVGQTQSLSMVDPELTALPLQKQISASPYMLPTAATPTRGDPPHKPIESRPAVTLQKTPSSSSATNPLYPTRFQRISSSNSAGGAPNSGERSYFDLIPESPFDEDDESDEMPLMKLTDEDRQVLMESLKEVEIDYPQLELLDTIGEGAFGKVHKGVLILPAYNSQQGYTKTLVAVKTIKSYSTKEELKSFLRESALMKHFNHPNVLGLIGICLNTPDHVPYIVLPFMANGDLRSFLRAKRGGRTSVSQLPNGLTLEHLLLICHQISCGMAYLAESKFVHRDLAARNCMIDDDLNVKVADFGLTRDIYMVDYYKQARLGRVPVKWMAPESLFDRVYNNKTDVWSFGVTCWEVFSLGRTPYAGMANHEIGPYLEKGGRLSKPPLCPDNMYAVIRWCWDGIPEDRPSFRVLADDIRNLVPENCATV